MQTVNLAAKKPQVDSPVVTHITERGAPLTIGVREYGDAGRKWVLSSSWIAGTEERYVEVVIEPWPGPEIEYSVYTTWNHEKVWVDTQERWQSAFEHTMGEVWTERFGERAPEAISPEETDEALNEAHQRMFAIGITWEEAGVLFGAFFRRKIESMLVEWSALNRFVRFETM